LKILGNNDRKQFLFDQLESLSINLTNIDNIFVRYPIRTSCKRLFSLIRCANCVYKYEYSVGMVINVVLLTVICWQDGLANELKVDNQFTSPASNLKPLIS